jgi:hypothetical protein
MRDRLYHNSPAGASHSSDREEGTMAKMSIRKAGTIRLTSAAYYCCAL